MSEVSFWMSIACALLAAFLFDLNPIYPVGGVIVGHILAEGGIQWWEHRRRRRNEMG